MGTEYRVTKTDVLERIAIDGKPTLIPLPKKKYYIDITTDDKDFLDFIDNGINNLIKRYETGEQG